MSIIEININIIRIYISAFLNNMKIKYNINKK